MNSSPAFSTLDRALASANDSIANSLAHGLSGPQLFRLMDRARGIQRAEIAGISPIDLGEEMKKFMEDLEREKSGATLPQYERWKEKDYPIGLGLLGNCRTKLRALSEKYTALDISEIDSSLVLIEERINWFFRKMGVIGFDQFKKGLAILYGKIDIFGEDIQLFLDEQAKSALEEKRIQEEQLATKKREQEILNEQEMIQAEMDAKRVNSMREWIFKVDRPANDDTYLLDQRTLEQRVGFTEKVVGTFSTDPDGRYFDPTGITNVYLEAIKPKDNVETNDADFIQKGIELYRKHRSKTLLMELEARRLRLQSLPGNIRDLSDIENLLESELLVVGSEGNMRLKPRFSSGKIIYGTLVNPDGSEVKCKFDGSKFSIYDKININVLDSDSGKWLERTINPLVIRQKNKDVASLVDQPTPDNIDNTGLQQQTANEIKISQEKRPGNMQGNQIEANPEEKSLGSRLLSRAKTAALRFFRKAA